MRTFCLDSCLSYRVAEALIIVDYAVTSVANEFPHPRGNPGGATGISDEEIAARCALSELVLVTVDDDFATKWVKSHLLAEQGLEVIVFSRQIEGLQEQHRRITSHYPDWQTKLDEHPYGYRVWEQPMRGRLRMMQGNERPNRKRRQQPTRRISSRTVPPIAPRR